MLLFLVSYRLKVSMFVHFTNNYLFCETLFWYWSQLISTIHTVIFVHFLILKIFLFERERIFYLPIHSLSGHNHLLWARQNSIVVSSMRGETQAPGSPVVVFPGIIAGSWIRQSSQDFLHWHSVTGCCTSAVSPLLHPYGEHF